MLLQALSGIPMCLSKHAVKIKFLDRPREVSDRVIKKIIRHIESLNLTKYICELPYTIKVRDIFETLILSLAAFGQNLSQKVQCACVIGPGIKSGCHHIFFTLFQNKNHTCNLFYFKGGIFHS